MSKYESRTERWRPRSPTLQEVEKSLDRYPDLGEQELAALIRQFRSLSVVDKAVIMGDVRLSRKLAVFYRHHEPDLQRSEEHTSELQSLMRISYAVFCLKKKKTNHSIEKHKNRQKVRIAPTNQ